MMTKSIIFVALIAAAVALAPVAHAEPSVDNTVCSQSKLGETPGQIAGQLHEGDPRYSIWNTTATVWQDLQNCP